MVYTLIRIFLFKGIYFFQFLPPVPVGGLLSDASLSTRGLIPAGVYQRSINLGGEYGYNILKIKFERTNQVSILVSFGFPSSNELVAINMAITTGSMTGKPYKLTVSYLAPVSSNIKSAKAYYNPTDDTNTIEIECGSLNYSPCTLHSSSIVVSSITKIETSEYSASAHTNYIEGVIKTM